MIRCMIVLLFLFQSNLVLAAANEHYTSAFYIDTFGRVNPEDSPLVERVETIYPKIRRATLTQGIRSPGLIILDTISRPWAVSLPDNNIILSIGAVELCYENVSLSQGDARIAFILGHELAHINNNEFWSHFLIRRLTDSDSDDDYLNKINSFSVIEQDVYSSLTHEARRINELKADDLGFIYASIAGFDIWDGLTANQRSFFDVWSEETGANKKSKSHQDNAVRHEMLLNRFLMLREDSRFAHFAIVMSQIGLYQDASDLMEMLVERYPSVQLSSALAQVKIMMALSDYSNQQAQLLLLPVLENRHGMEQFEKSLTADNLFQARERLSQAKQHLGFALSMSPNYLPALINLAIVNYYLDEPYQARAAIEQAYKIESDQWYIAMLRDLIVFKQEVEIDMWPRTVTKLEALHKSNPQQNILKYNLAALYLSRNRQTEAGKHIADIFHTEPTDSPLYQLTSLLAPNNVETSSQQGSSRKKDNFDLLDHAHPISPIDFKKIQRSYREIETEIRYDERAMQLYINNALVTTIIKRQDYTQLNCQPLMTHSALIDNGLEKCDGNLFIQPYDNESAELIITH